MLKYKNWIPALGFAVATTGLAAQTFQVNRENKTIAISASDEATATADIAAITVGFELYGPEAKSLALDAGKLSHEIFDALRKVGVPEAAIESDEQKLARNEDLSDKLTVQERREREFVFRQSWIVSVPVAKAAEVIRVVVSTGANRSGEIDWRLSDRKALQAKAAEAALVKARAVAEHMAEGLHVKLGALIFASNETPKVGAYRLMKLEVMDGVGGRSPVMPPPPPPPPPSLEIRPKTISEEATVYAVFAIE